MPKSLHPNEMIPKMAINLLKSFDVEEKSVTRLLVKLLDDIIDDATVRKYLEDNYKK